MTPEQLEAAITPKTRALILCSPSNPTGSVYSADELEALAQVLLRHEQVYVIADEIYEHINYVGRHASIASNAALKPRVVVVNGVSKAYAMTGWRIGFIAGPEWIVKGCNKLQGQYTSGPCSVSQKAAEAAYTGSQQCVEDMRLAFERRRNLIVRLARQIPGLEVNEPDGAFYLFVRAPEEDAAAFCQKARQYELLLVPSDSFGCPGYVRLAYCVSTDMIRRSLPAFRQLAESYGLI